MRLLITGSSGFIGSHLVAHALADNHEVFSLSRSSTITSGKQHHFTWSLSEAIPQEALNNIDCAIHLAHDFNGEDGASSTIKGTAAIMKQLRQAGVKKQLFFSSYSAGQHAVSLYGKVKSAIEDQCMNDGDILIIRPGLVLGDGGIYGRIKKFSQKFPIIPVPDGGHGKVPVIQIEALCKQVIEIASNTSENKEFNLYESELQSLRSLIKHSAAQVNKKPILVPVPSKLVFFGFKIAKLLRIRLPVNEDNLQGFLSNQHAKHRSTSN